jgi:hypothetical protein
MKFHDYSISIGMAALAAEGSLTRPLAAPIWPFNAPFWKKRALKGQFGALKGQMHICMCI